MALTRPTLCLLALLTGCAEIQTLGASAIQHRQVMNDLQARATMHALADISVGAYFRELNARERELVRSIVDPMWVDEVERLEATP